MERKAKFTANGILKLDCLLLAILWCTHCLFLIFRFIFIFLCCFLLFLHFLFLFLGFSLCIFCSFSLLCFLCLSLLHSVLHFCLSDCFGSSFIGCFPVSGCPLLNQLFVSFSIVFRIFQKSF